MAHAARHINREYQPENADPERAKNNKVYGCQSRAEVMSKMKERLSTVKRKLRPDAIRAVQYMVTHSPDLEIDSQKYLESASKWIEERHGKENVLSIAIHNDEKTPHLHALVVPIRETEKGNSLSAKFFFSGKAKLSRMQTDFHERVGSKFNLSRGIEKSGARHTTIREYYGMLKKGPEIDLEKEKGLITKKGRKAVSEKIRRQNGAYFARLETQNRESKAELKRLRPLENRIESLEKAFQIKNEENAVLLHRNLDLSADLKQKDKDAAVFTESVKEITTPEQRKEIVQNYKLKMKPKSKAKTSQKTRSRSIERDEGR